MVTAFEEKLCDKICDICLNMPGSDSLGEADFKSELSVASWFQPVRKKNGFSVGCEKDKYTTTYNSTGCATNGLVLNSRGKNPSTQLTGIKQKRCSTFKPAIDVLYENFSGTEEYLLELKYPRWKYSTGKSGNYAGPARGPLTGKPFAGTVIFLNPFFTHYGVVYLTDEQEGEMFTDFIRLLNLYKSRPSTAPKITLYFCAFFKTADLSTTTSVPPVPDFSGFCSRIAELFSAYQNSPGMPLFTRNPYGQVDIWDYEPCSISYFHHISRGCFVEKKFPTPVTSPIPPFHLLHQTGGDHFAFLVKIQP